MGFQRDAKYIDNSYLETAINKATGKFDGTYADISRTHDGVTIFIKDPRKSSNRSKNSKRTIDTKNIENTAI